MRKSTALRVENRRTVDGQVISGMRAGLVLGLFLALCLTQAAVGKDTEVIASFENPSSIQNWISVNDGVMGGVSKGGFERTERKTLLFTGVLSLENNGGFASIRTESRSMDLAGASGIIVKARGDGRTYWVSLRTARQFGASSYRSSLPTAKGEFSEILIPLSDFKLEAFGQQIPGSPLDPASIASVGFTIADKKPGPFELEIEYIKAVFEEADQASNGIIHVIDQVLLPPEDSAEPLTPLALIQLAINRGVPLFNSGAHGACAAVYEVTCEALRSMPGVSEDSRKDLAQALASMRAAKTEREKAWILRHALDRVLARGAEGE
jgi:monofunctional biosynthetic peptidoglycan transglycosylase